MIDEDGYYSLRAILGYNCKYNIVLSDRGRGKSFAAKHFLIEQPGTAMCLYRTSSDMIMAINSWIDPLLSKRKNLKKFKVYSADQFVMSGNDKEGYVLYFDGEPKIWFRYLTQVNHIKQEVFPDDMNWVWLDEFIPMAYKKLPGIDSEGDAIRTIIKTIEHDTNCTREERGLKPVRMIMYANPFTWNNPILSYFKLRPGIGIKKVGPGIVCEMMPPSVDNRKSKKMTVDDFLGNDVNLTQGWEGETAFVEDKWGSDLTPYLSVRVGRQFFSIYVKSGMKGRWFAANAGDHKMTAGMVSSDRWGSKDGLREDECCLDGSTLLKLIQEKIRRGQMRYKDLNSKFDFQNAIGELR